MKIEAGILALHLVNDDEGREILFMRGDHEHPLKVLMSHLGARDITNTVVEFSPEELGAILQVIENQMTGGKGVRSLRLPEDHPGEDWDRPVRIYCDNMGDPYRTGVTFVVDGGEIPDAGYHSSFIENDKLDRLQKFLKALEAELVPPAGPRP